MTIIGDHVKRINSFFRNAIKSEIDDKHHQLMLTEEQTLIFKLKYIEKRDINYIADKLGYSEAKINGELKTIRNKLIKII